MWSQVGSMSSSPSGPSAFWSPGPGGEAEQTELSRGREREGTYVGGGPDSRTGDT